MKTKYVEPGAYMSKEMLKAFNSEMKKQSAKKTAAKPTKKAPAKKKGK